MKLITRDTDYAIRALCSITKNKERLVSAAELVKELKIPRPFLRKLLQILNRRGILKSYKGKGGGFELAVPAEKIAITDLMKIFQGSLNLNKCFFKKLLCPNTKTCVLRKKINKIEGYVIRELGTISIASIIH